MKDRITPHWNAAARQLWFGGDLLKAFLVPAQIQVAILAAFEEMGWPSRIDDPLPPRDGTPAKDRLKSAIRSLNRNQRVWRVQFSGDGTGAGILWSPRQE